MDTVTQIALGAAVGEAVLGRQVGKRALLWGGICGLFPDLDVLIPLGDAVKNFTYHRGPSHSLFVLTGLTPVFVGLILRLHPQTYRYRTRWHALVYLAFATHVLLDCEINIPKTIIKKAKIHKILLLYINLFLIIPSKTNGRAENINIPYSP